MLSQFWHVLVDNLDVFSEGFLMTIRLFAMAGLGALILGGIIGAMRVSPVPIMRMVGTVYVNLVRNTPLTLLMLFFAVGYPKLSLPDVDYWLLATIALTLYTASYVAETVRSGINTVPIGQAEAARAIGLTFGQTLSQVILPQAFRAVVPPLFSVLIALLKNTTVASAFSVVEAGAIRSYLSERGEPAMMVLIWVALIFVVLVFLLSSLQRHLENKWKVA